MKTRRFTLTDINSSTFYQLPKFLFDKEKISGIDLIAKVLYAIYLDRLNLSIKNRWVNSSGEVYLIFRQSELAELLDCSMPTLRRAIKQLTAANLIEVEEQNGFNKANKVYVNYLDFMEKPGEPEQQSENHAHITEEVCPETVADSTKNTDTYEKESLPCMEKIFTPNKTNHNKTDYYKSINQRKMEKTEKIDAMDIKHARKKAKKQIMPEFICETTKCSKSKVDEIISLIAEVYSTKKNYLRINSENMDIKAVRKRFKSINEEHVSYVLSCMENTTGEIRNIKNYLLTALYNAPSTMDTYYQNLFNRTYGVAYQESKPSYDFDKINSFYI